MVQVWYSEYSITQMYIFLAFFNDFDKLLSWLVLNPIGMHRDLTQSVQDKQKKSKGVGGVYIHFRAKSQFFSFFPYIFY